MKEKFRVQYFTICTQSRSNFRNTRGYTNQLSAVWKKSSVGVSGEEYSDLIKELALKIMISSFLKNRLELAQTTKSINGRTKYKF